MRKLQIMNECSGEVLRRLCANMSQRVSVYLPGDVICEQGDIGHTMYYVQAGEIEHTEKSAVFNFVKKASIQKGDFFAER